MASNKICPQVKASAIRMRIAGMTVSAIAMHLDVSINTLFKWTRFIPHPNRRLDNNMIVNARLGVIGRLKSKQKNSPKWQTLLGTVYAVKMSQKV